VAFLAAMPHEETVEEIGSGLAQSAQILACARLLY
jgi:hypothetical protein